MLNFILGKRIAFAMFLPGDDTMVEFLEEFLGIIKGGNDAGSGGVEIEMAGERLKRAKRALDTFVIFVEEVNPTFCELDNVVEGVESVVLDVVMEEST